MLKVALYFMVFFLLVSAIVIFIFAVNKGNKKKLNIINSAYLVISLINYMMFLEELIDTGWNLIFVTSHDYYVAIVNSKPHKVSLAKNIFSREATYDTNDYMEFASYNVTLESTGEIKFNAFDVGGSLRKITYYK